MISQLTKNILSHTPQRSFVLPTGMPIKVPSQKGKKMQKLYGNNDDIIEDSTNEEDSALVYSQYKDIDEMDKLPLSGLRLPFASPDSMFFQKGYARITQVPQVRQIKWKSEVDNSTQHVFDASQWNNKRMSKRIADLLQGKHKRNQDLWKVQADHVIVVNSSRTRCTQNQLWRQWKLWHSQWPGGMKRISIRRLLNEFPNRLIQDNIFKTLPSNKLRDTQMNEYLHVQPYENHEFTVKGIPQITLKQPPTTTHQQVHEVNTQKKAMQQEIAKQQSRSIGSIDKSSEIDESKIIQNQYEMRKESENRPQFNLLSLEKVDEHLDSQIAAAKGQGYIVDESQVIKEYERQKTDKWQLIRGNEYQNCIRDQHENGKINIEGIELLRDFDVIQDQAEKYLNDDKIDEELRFDLKLIKNRNQEMEESHDFSQNEFRQQKLMLDKDIPNQVWDKSKMQFGDIGDEEIKKIQSYKKKYMKKMRNIKVTQESAIRWFWRREEHKERDKIYKKYGLINQYQV